jgi:hypothetical protein
VQRVLERVERAASRRLASWVRPLEAPGRRLLLRWEALPAYTQILISFPTLVVLLFVLHVTLFVQPVGRSILYGVFWAVLGTYLVVIATRTEAAKRAHREQEGDDEP